MILDGIQKAHNNLTLTNPLCIKVLSHSRRQCLLCSASLLDAVDAGGRDNPYPPNPANAVSSEALRQNGICVWSGSAGDGKAVGVSVAVEGMEGDVVPVNLREDGMLVGGGEEKMTALRRLVTMQKRGVGRK